MTGGRVLVLGSEGNIGRPLVRRLREQGCDVLEADIRPGWRPGYIQADINHPLDLTQAFDWHPKWVFMLSAMVSRVTCEQAPSLAISTNLAGLNNVIQLCKRVNSKLIYFSTSEVYGPRCHPMSETVTDPMPNNRYGLTKLLGEKLVEYEVEHYGLAAITLRPFMMYDEDEDFGPHRSAMIRFAHDLVRGEPIEVHRGSARGWLHVSDGIAAICSAATYPDYSVVNIGHDAVIPIEELAERLCAEVGADPSLIEIVEQPPQMTLVKQPTLERMRTMLKVEPQVNLDEGIRRVCRRTMERLGRPAADLEPRGVDGLRPEGSKHG